MGSFREGVGVYITSSGGGGQVVWLHGVVEQSPQLSVNPTDISLGTHPAGTSFSKTFIVKNAGGSTLTGNISESVSWITSVNPSGFSLDANQSRTINIQGTFPNSGFFSTSANITSNGGNKNVYVHGIVEQSPQLLVSPNDIDLGTHQAGTSFSKTFSVKNTGGGTLTGNFSESVSWITSISPTSFSLGVNQSRTITMQGSFPSNSGSFDTNVSVTSSGGNKNVYVHGSVEQSPQLSVNPTDISLGTHPAGTSFSKTLIVKNEGGGTLTGNISENVSWITSMDPSSFSLSANQSRTINIQGTFPNSGSFNTNVNVTSNGGNQNVYVYGIVSSNQLSITPSNRNVDLNADSTTFTVTSSNISWTVSSDVSWLSLSPTSGGSGATTLTANYKANSSTQQRVATITVTGNGANATATVTQARQNGGGGWADGFESDTTGTFPSNWVADGNGTDISTNYVDNTQSYVGLYSLKLFGVIGGCWAALAYRPIILNAPFEVELDVRNGNESLSGCHPDRASIGLREGTSWVNPGRRFVNFKNDGSLESGGGNVNLGTYSTLTWYTVKIQYERPSTSEVKLSYWINGNYKGSETLPAISHENLLTNLNLTVNEGTAWFDDVKVSKINTDNVALSANGAIATAITEGTFKGITHYASMAIDGDTNSFWASEWSMPAWLEVEFDKMYDIEKVGVWWGTHQHTFSIELSLDGTNWTTVVSSRLSNNTEDSRPVHELFLINSTEAKYIRINIESTSAPFNHIFQAAIAELEAYSSVNTGVKIQQFIVPKSVLLKQNYPNPFNPKTTINYEIPKSAFVTVKVYNIDGQLVATLVNEQKSAGSYSVTWNAQNAGSGIYLYRITAGSFSKEKKCIVLK